MPETLELPCTVRLPVGPVVVRRFAPTDSLQELTALLHRAYAELAARGMKFIASHQDHLTTRRRIEGGTCLVATHDDHLVATVTWHAPGVRVPEGSPYWYTQPGVARLNQFAVEPALQGRGLGGVLLDVVEAQATAEGATELALDTAESALMVKEWILRRGYREVGKHRWSLTNYPSVVLSRTLGQDA